MSMFRLFDYVDVQTGLAVFCVGQVFFAGQEVHFVMNSAFLSAREEAF